MNLGKNLTLVRTIRPAGSVTLTTDLDGMTAERFTLWVGRRIVPRLRPGDIVLLDDLRAHDAPEAAAVRRVGARLKFLPPQSPGFSPIEPAWGLTKKAIRAHAQRTADALCRVAHRARQLVRLAHGHAWFAQAGYRQLK